MLFFLKSLTYFSPVLSGFDLNWFVFFISISYQNGQFNYVNDQQTTAAKTPTIEWNHQLFEIVVIFKKFPIKHTLFRVFFVIVVASLWHFKSWKYFHAYVFVWCVCCCWYWSVFFSSSLDANGDEYKVNFTNCTSRINVSSHKYTVGGMKVHANNIDPII